MLKRIYLVIFTDLTDNPPKSIPLLLFVPFIKSVLLFASAMSFDSVDKPPEYVLLSGLLLDAFRAITIDGFITTKITDKSIMNISNDILSL